MYKCPFCENLTYDWEDTWDIEKKKEVMKIVSEHVETHPESRPIQPENQINNEEEKVKQFV